MKIGMVGLGKMGFNLVLNLMENGHEVVANDINKDAMNEIESKGAQTAPDYKTMVEMLPQPRVIWLMIPAGDLIDQVIDGFTPYLESGDILIDGGNSNYKDTVRRANKLFGAGIHFMDVGTSGGMEGARNGACTMIGGDADVFAHVEPI